MVEEGFGKGFPETIKQALRDGQAVFNIGGERSDDAWHPACMHAPVACLFSVHAFNLFVID